MIQDSVTSTLSTPVPESPITPESILSTLESALAELTDLAVLIDTAKAAEAQLLKLFELHTSQFMAPPTLVELTKAVHVLYRLTSIRKTLISTVTSLIDRHASPKEAQTKIAQTLAQLRAESQSLSPVPNTSADETVMDEVPEISEISEIGEINEIDEIGEVDEVGVGEMDDAEELSVGSAEARASVVDATVPGPEGAKLTGPISPNPSAASVMGSPTPNKHESHRDGRNLPAPRPNSNPAADSAPDSDDSDPDSNANPSSLPPVYVRGVRACPYLPGLTESELARLVFYIGSLQGQANLRRLQIRTPRRPPIWHPPAWGGFKLEDTRPLSFPTKCFDPNFDPCRPATWSPEMIAAEYRREIPFFPSHELLGPIPPDPSAAAPQPAADTPSADPHPTAPSSLAGSWVGDGSHEEDAPIEDDWDAEDEWDEDEPWADTPNAPSPQPDTPRATGGPPDPG